MEAKEFNKKYEKYLEEKHYGVEGFNNPEFLEWLDAKFQIFITFENFKFSQIKTKFGMGRFYCEGLPNELINEVENKITELCKKIKT